MRCFLAISVPDTLSDALLDLQDRVRNARWIDEASFHITLIFLGNCEPDQLDELHTGLSSIRMDSFELTPSGSGAFGKTKPNNLHIRFEECEPLRRLQLKAGRFAQAASIPIERRKFVPHITLARCSGGVIPAQAKEWVERHHRFKADPFLVSAFSLYRSDIGNGPPVYTELARYELTPPERVEG